MSNVMREYEAILIARPETEADVPKLQGQFTELVARHKGQVTQNTLLGKKRFNHRIQKLNEGVHLQLRFQLPPAEVAALKKAARMSESVLRFFMVKDPGASEGGAHGESQ